MLTDGILDQLAKFERAKTAERTRRGRMRKAQEGKIAGGRDELSKIDDLDTEMDRLEDLRAALLFVENPFSGH